MFKDAPILIIEKINFMSWYSFQQGRIAGKFEKHYFHNCF